MQTKKQAFELITGICDINEKVWGNHAGSYDDFKEAAYQVEEALEGFTPSTEKLYDEYGNDIIDNSDGQTPKDWSRDIVSWAQQEGKPLADVDRFDKALDAIYFAIGSMHKLGLTPHQIVEGLQVVHSANLAKTGEKDSEGKVIKPDNFVPPEDQLQKILDQRG